MSEVVKIQVDAMTGEVTTETLTTAEIESINSSNEAMIAEHRLSEAAKIAARESARAKLASLGLTESEISALVGA